MEEIFDTELEKLQNDRIEIQKRLEMIEQEKTNLTKSLLSIEGAIQATNYYKSKLEKPSDVENTDEDYE